MSPERVSFYFEKYHKNLRYFAQSVLDSAVYSDDIVSDVFFIMLKNPDNKHDDNDASVKRWLFYAVKHRCLNRLKHQSVLKKFNNRFVANEWEDGYFFESKKVKSEVIVSYISKLPQIQKEVIVLNFYHKINLLKIAGLLNKTINSIEKVKARALNNLKKIMSMPYEDDPFFIKRDEDIRNKLISNYFSDKLKDIEVNVLTEFFIKKNNIVNLSRQLKMNTRTLQHIKTRAINKIQGVQP
jgi:RNA polymerase sigma-70 factor, ECF subfamily